MSCPHHKGLCAYPEPSDDRCSQCHTAWSKITAPATEVTSKPGVHPKTKQPIVIEEIHYLHGYGETPLNHFWRHALANAKAEADAARLAAKRRAA